MKKFSHLLDLNDDGDSQKKDMNIGKSLMASAGGMAHLRDYSGARKLTASTKDGSSNEEDQLEAFHN